MCATAKGARCVRLRSCKANTDLPHPLCCVKSSPDLWSPCRRQTKTGRTTMAKKPTAIPESTRLPTGAVAQRYGVSTRSVDRWWKDSQLNFPQPIIVRQRKYWALADLETWERKRAAGEPKEIAAA